MKFIYSLLVLVMLPAYASVVQLESGSFEVKPVDRYGRVQVCTFEIENVEADDMLVLNVNDCPPVITDVKLFKYEGDAFYISQKVPSTTSAREGYKMYEIHPITPTQFKMVSYREYANGQVDKPRSIIANKR